MKSILHLHLESNVADPDLPDSLNFSGSKSVSVGRPEFRYVKNCKIQMNPKYL